VGHRGAWLLAHARGPLRVKGHHLEVGGGQARGLEGAGLVDRVEHGARMHSRIDLARAPGEEDLRRQTDRARELLRVTAAEAIGDEREPPAAGAYPAGGLVRDERTERS